jgi:biopolymer transport protein ExbB
MSNVHSTLFAGPLGQLIDMGGPVMVVLLAMAVLGVVTFFYLMLYGTFCTPRRDKRVKQLVSQWQTDPATADPARAVAGAGLRARMNPLLHLVANTVSASQAQADPEQVRATAARDAQHALEPFEAPLKIIEVIAALAPLLGLLGTVMGMMDAFSAMAATEGRANAAQLSGGIYEALATTAAGLVVAIPFAALAAWIEFRLRRVHQTVNSTLVTVLHAAPPEASAPAAAQQDRTAAAPGTDESGHAYSLDHKQRLVHAAG